jgi:hypothetical protein
MDRWQELKECLLEAREDDRDDLNRIYANGDHNSYGAGICDGRIDLANAILSEFFEEKEHES